MADAARLHLLVTTDWSPLCAAGSFCFRCASPVCSHCCANHGDTHHPHGHQPPRVVTVRGAPALEAFGIDGYDFRRVQRVRLHQIKHIMIRPVGVPDQRCKSDICENCGRRSMSGSRWCSLACRLESVPGGVGRAAALHLVAIAQQFGQPIHALDRFCLICGRAFGAQSCPSHLQHHAGDPLAGPASIVRIQHFDGWAVVPEGQLPPDFIANVQGITLDDGTIGYPIHRRGGDGGHPPHAAGQPHACLRDGCPEQFTGIAGYCSLRCRHAQ